MISLEWNVVVVVAVLEVYFLYDQTDGGNESRKMEQVFTLVNTEKERINEIISRTCLYTLLNLAWKPCGLWYG